MTTEQDVVSVENAAGQGAPGGASAAGDAVDDRSGRPALDEVQVRVLGCLVEKATTTPDSYPLSVNALRNACNQKSSRDPVMDVAEAEVDAALVELRRMDLAKPVRESGARVTKFRHAVDEAWDLDSAQRAVVSVLALRGPQTVGEVRTRTTRQHEFASVDEAAGVMQGLAEQGFVAELPRGHGQKETRWTHLLGGPLDAVAVAAASGGLDDVVADFLAGAEAVVAAVANPLVAHAWDDPSVLEDQTVGSLCGHVARGGVWLAADYMDRERPSGEPFWASAADYFRDVGQSLSDADHEAIRARGGTEAADGHGAVVKRARAGLDRVRRALIEAEVDSLVAVLGGRSIRLDDYLVTRMVEQAVHLDDLARSVDGLDVDVPDSVARRAMTVGVEALAARAGRMAALRTLYRRGFTNTLPVTRSPG